jgi:hypothetical protein
VTQAISEKMQSEGLNITIQSLLLDDHATNIQRSMPRAPTLPLLLMHRGIK